MITDERFTAYINSLENGNPSYLDELEAYSKKTQVPIIRKETQSLIRTLLVMNKPKRILEVGTAIGFSALFMREFMPKDGHITTIEKYEKRIPLASENFKRFDTDERITLIEGDAADVLKQLEGPFDFIFMDAAKGQYIYFLPELVRLLETDGILVTDNVLQDGDILESRFAVTRRNRTIHKRMRQFLYEVMHHEEFISSVLPVGDGLTVSSKIDRNIKKIERENK